MDIEGTAAIALDENRPRRDRNQAVKALGQSGDTAAVAPLTSALEDRKLAVVAATALGALGHREGVPALIEILTGSGDKVARFAAAGALGKIGDPTAAEALRGAAKKDRDSSVRSNANKALRRLEREAAAVAPGHPDDPAVQRLVDEAKERRVFNLPIVLGGLVIVGGISYWVDPGSFATTLLVLIVVAVVVFGINLMQGWLKNR